MNKLAALIPALLLSACATVTPLSESDDKMTSAIGTVPTSWLLTLPDDLSQVSQWSDIYEDPILVNYLRMAQANNFDMRIAQKRLDESRAALRQSTSLLKPRINASASASGSALIGSVDTITDSYGTSLSGFWDPDLFGQTRAAINQSRAGLALQQALSENTKQTVLSQTATAYIRAVESELQVKLAKTNLDFLTESRRISEARYRAGDTAKGDFSFAEANYQSALVSFENTKQSARAARRALSVLLGDYPGNDLSLADDLTNPALLPPRDMPARVLERRPDIAAARARVARSAAALQIAQLGDWPDVSVTGGLSSSSRFKDIFDPSDYIARLGASLAGNIFDGGANQASRDSARAGLDANILEYEATLRSAIRDIEDAYDRADNLRRNLVNLQASSDAANEALRLESVQYDLGESSLLDVLQVQTRVNAIDATLIRTKAALLENTISAYQAIGGYSGKF